MRFADWNVQFGDLLLTMSLKNLYQKYTKLIEQFLKQVSHI